MVYSRKTVQEKLNPQPFLREAQKHMNTILRRPLKELAVYVGIMARYMELTTIGFFQVSRFEGLGLGFMVLLLMLKILYDLETLEDQNSKKIKYLWSCRISSINRRTILGLGVQYLRLERGMSLSRVVIRSARP